MSAAWTAIAPTPPAPWTPVLVLTRRPPQLREWVHHLGDGPVHCWERRLGGGTARIWYDRTRRDQHGASYLQRARRWRFQLRGYTTRWLSRDDMCRRLLERYPFNAAAWVQPLLWDTLLVEESWR